MKIRIKNEKPRFSLKAKLPSIESIYRLKTAVAYKASDLGSSPESLLTTIDSFDSSISDFTPSEVCAATAGTLATGSDTEAITLRDLTTKLDKHKSMHVDLISVLDLSAEKHAAYTGGP